MNVFGVTGWKNSGKTGLMERLVSEITSRGFSVSTVKNAHHSVDVDHPGKDSHRHRVAGATEVVLSSTSRWALMHELRGAADATLEEHLGRMMPVDLILVEGFKKERHPKIEAHRQETSQGLIAANDPTIVAVASDAPLAQHDGLRFDLDNTKEIADFILKKMGLMKTDRPKGKGLRNDCFALPEGVNWIPVEDALARLKETMPKVAAVSEKRANDALGLTLAQDAIALRDNPPAANSAVDGFGFAFNAITDDTSRLPLMTDVAAAGHPFEGSVPKGTAIRILTGALVPAGVDTVVMQEDVDVEGDFLLMEGRPKVGANVRAAGEDLKRGQVAVTAGTVIRPLEIAMMAAVGVTEIQVFEPLRIGVLSTGSEIVDAGTATDRACTYDANRPMLLSMLARWGAVPVDLGHVEDDREALKSALTTAAKTVDVIFTSGGASEGKEDHLSALLNEEGAMTQWRVALKPGRPMAMGIWDGVPLFGFPGNPVAAMVCALVFARPAVAQMGGGSAMAPQGFMVPAAFSKKKKEGRSEYLRARMTADGRVETFHSEGSGRVSGLSWAGGLVELPHHGVTIEEGTLVRFIPYGSFGL
ncbi:MAG: bifunctional molybdopterin-guanine dinucleotide biosynthesis adaptor protein MobB/molybdopterin molybdotransferase MoeA [Halocynthiibacter sp.]